MDTKQYKIKSGKVTFASPVPHLICTNGAWVQISANSKGKARAHVRCGQTMDLFFLFTLDLKRKTRCLTLLRINQIMACSYTKTDRCMNEFDRSVNGQTHFGGKGGEGAGAGARPLTITPSTLVKGETVLYSCSQPPPTQPLLIK